MTTSPPGPKHSCVSQFLIVNIHLYFTLSVGGGASSKLLFLVREPPLSSLLTCQMVNMHLNHSEGARPIQFILPIILLKCSVFNVTEPNISTKLSEKLCFI